MVQNYYKSHPQQLISYNPVFFIPSLTRELTREIFPSLTRESEILKKNYGFYSQPRVQNEAIGNRETGIEVLVIASWAGFQVLFPPLIRQLPYAASNEWRKHSLKTNLTRDRAT